MEKTALLHASGGEIRFPGIRLSEHTKDFSWGFYCTNSYKQAWRWAARKQPSPTINYYKLDDISDLNILKFDKMTAEWLDFVAKCRSGASHEFDIVEGPMADDQVWNFVDDFLEGKLLRKHFSAYAEFQQPTHQISFHTIKALSRINFLRSETINDS